ncbi:MAG: CHAT domain-containing tetratricopeptide repeat protein [Bacteroidota bacterium]
MRFILAILICFLISNIQAQFGKKFGKFLEQTAEGMKEDQAEREKVAFENMQLKQLVKDTTYYNFALSQAEKVSFFTSRDDDQNVFLFLAKNYEDEEQGVKKPNLKAYQQAFDFNRSGGTSLVINKQAALFNFSEALRPYFSSTALLGFVMNPGSPLDSITAYIPEPVMDTLTTPDYYAIAKSLINFGIFYHSVGQYSFAEQLNKSTIEFIKSQIGSESLALASVYNNIALLEHEFGNYTKSEEYLMASKQILEGRKDEIKLDLAILNNNLAMLYQEVGQYKNASTSINQALELASDKLSKKSADYSKIRINKALILKAQKIYQDAEKELLALKKLKEARFGRKHQDYADIQVILSALYLEQGKTERVEALLKNALDIYEKKFSVNHPTYSNTLLNLAKYQLLVDDYDEALNNILRSEELILANYEETHPDYLKSLENKAVVEWNMGDIQNASTSFRDLNELILEQLVKFFPAMSENEKSKFWSKNRPSILKFYAFAMENHKSDETLLDDLYDLQLTTKGILFNTSSKLRNKILSGDDEELKSLYSQWKVLKEELGYYYTLSKRDVGERNINIDSLEKASNQLERALNQKSSLFAQSNSINQITSSDLSEKLSANELAIEIIRIPKFKKRFEDQVIYGALILDQSGRKKLAVIENGNDLEGKLSSYYKRSIQYKVDDNISYDNYWKPIEPLITDGARIFISSDGIYNQINLNTLKTDEGSFLSEKYQFVNLTSTRDIDKIALLKKGKASDLLMFGYPDFGNSGSIAELPGTKVELEKIGGLAKRNGLNVSQFTEKQASESVLKEKVNNPDVLHIATHGYFLNDLPEGEDVVYGVEISKAKENPLLRSGLMLANAESTVENLNVREVSTSDNGILTAYEAMNLDLNDTEMVVLSACETGLGESKSGEGVYGLQRAFQIAGASTIMMSLWKVDDAATQKLMTNFYSKWISTGDKLESFLYAQNILKEEYKEPFYWGAFILMN